MGQRSGAMMSVKWLTIALGAFAATSFMLHMLHTQLGPAKTRASAPQTKQNWAVTQECTRKNRELADEVARLRAENTGLKRALEDQSMANATSAFLDPGISALGSMLEKAFLDGSWKGLASAGVDSQNRLARTSMPKDENARVTDGDSDEDDETLQPPSSVNEPRTVGRPDTEFSAHKKQAPKYQAVSRLEEHPETLKVEEAELANEDGNATAGILPFWRKYHRNQHRIDHQKFALYFSSVKRLLQVQRAMKNGEQMVLTVHTTGQAQLCNRIRNLMSGMLLGVVLERGVIGDSMKGYSASFDDIFQSPMGVDAFTPGSSIAVSRSRQQDTLCQDFKQYARTPTLKIQGLSWLGKLLFLNPTLHDQFVAKVGTHRNAYQATILHLLEPAKSVQDWFESFYRRHELSAKVMISIHIRNGFYKLQDIDWLHYRQCAELVTMRVLQRKSKDLPVAWYVTTDSAVSLERSRSFFQGATTHQGRPIELLYITENNSNAFTKANQLGGVQQALVDLLLLSLGDGRVLTPGSSYSGFAFSVAGPGSDSIYVRSANRAKAIGPWEEAQVENRSEWCFEPNHADPVMEGLDKMVADARCRRSVQQDWLDNG